MSDLNRHFRQSGYTLHRAALRRERLPCCCRENLCALTVGIQFMNNNGSKELLPLWECAACGKRYALSDERYLPINSLLQFETEKLM